MIPISEEERETIKQQHYPMVRTLVSPWDFGIQREFKRLTYDTEAFTPIPANLQRIRWPKPALSEVLGYEPLISATINNDLDSLVDDATIRMHLGTGIRNLAPFMNGPGWEWGDFEPTTPNRVLLDSGIYIQLQAKLVSRYQRIVVPQPPAYGQSGIGVSTSATGAAGSVSPPWPSHQTKHVGIMVVVSAGAQSPVLTTAAGFALMGSATVGSGGTGVRLALYWCRATSSSMSPPTLTNPGDFVFARIHTYTGCIETGNPYDTSPVFSTSGSATNVSFPALDLTTRDNRIVFVVAGSADFKGPQTNGLLSMSVTTINAQAMEKRADGWRDVGSGGGYALSDVLKTVNGSMGATIGGFTTLLQAQSQVRAAFALKPPPVRSVIDDPNLVPWQPFFNGRIDSAVPSRSEVDVLEVKARGMYADLLDNVLIPPGQSGYTFDPDDIQTLLIGIFDLKKPSLLIPPVGDYGVAFNIEGDPEVFVPQVYVPAGKNILQTMRDYALQTGWDVRPRWGTPGFPRTSQMLCYYEPDRLSLGNFYIVEPREYFTLGGLGKDRTEVRNEWTVTPSEDRANPITVSDQNSQLKYGYRPAALSEDEASLIQNSGQATLLGGSLLSDTKEPKISSEVEMRFFPWVELNDLWVLVPNNVQHSAQVRGAVSGYTHNIVARGMSKTTVRLRGAAASASREWRKKTGAKRQFVEPGPPRGSAPEGSHWHHRRD